MKSYDVIVVGAGPAGSTFATQLKKRGLTIKLLDKSKFPRLKPCAGWVTPQVIEALQIDIDDYRRKLTFQAINGFRTGLIGGRMNESHYPRTVSFGIRRIEFDNYLLQRSGVPCEMQAVRKIERHGNQWHINERYSAPLLVGAGGHFCPVARHVRESEDASRSDISALGRNQSNQPQLPVVYAQEIEFEVDDDGKSSQAVTPSIPELYFCKDLKGYGWCFRKGNFLNVGLGRLEKNGLSAQVKEFWEFLRSRKKVIGNSPSRFLGHAYRLYAQAKPKLSDEGLLLIGDSAALAYSQSGEGIRPAIESALIAAQVVSSANGDFSSSSLAIYRTKLVARLGHPPTFPSTTWLPAAWLQSIASRLMASRWFAKNVVIDRWFLHQQQATLESTRHDVVEA